MLEASYISSEQGRQGATRRRTDGTSHKETRSLTQRWRNRAAYSAERRCLRCTNCSGGLRRRFPPRGSPRRSICDGVLSQIACFNLINPVLITFDQCSAKFIPFEVRNPYGQKPFNFGVFGFTPFFITISGPGYSVSNHPFKDICHFTGRARKALSLSRSEQITSISFRIVVPRWKKRVFLT